MKLYIKTLLASFILAFAGISQSLADTTNAYDYVKVFNTRISPDRPYIDFEYPDWDSNNNDDAIRNVEFYLIDDYGKSWILSRAPRCHDDMERFNSDYGAMQVTGEHQIGELRIIHMRYWPSAFAMQVGKKMKFHGWWDIDDNSEWTQRGPDDYNIDKTFNIDNLLNSAWYELQTRGTLKYDGERYYIEGYGSNTYTGWTRKVRVTGNAQTVYPETLTSGSTLMLNKYGYEYVFRANIYTSLQKTTSVRNGCFGNHSDEVLYVTQRFNGYSYETQGAPAPTFSGFQLNNRNIDGRQVFEISVNSFSPGVTFDVYRRVSGSSDADATLLARNVAIQGTTTQWVDTSENIEEDFTYDFNLRSSEWNSEKHYLSKDLNKTGNTYGIKRLPGDGTESSPYLIGSTEDFQTFAWFVNSGKINDKVWKLTTDISLFDEVFSVGYGETKPFRGIFEGDGRTLTIKKSSDGPYDVALFGNISGATIRNLNVRGIYKVGSKYGAGIAALSTSGKIINCRVSLNINSNLFGDGTHGGIVGHTIYSQGYPTLIENCIFDGSINGSSTKACGGILGWNHVKEACVIKNTLCLGTFSVSKNACDAIARNNAIIENCYYLNDLESNSTRAVKLDDSYKGTGLLEKFGIGTYVYRPASYPMLKMFVEDKPADIISDGTSSLLTSSVYSGVDFTLNGTFEAGKKCTIILPFDLTAAEVDDMGEFYELQHFDAATRSVYFRRLVGTLSAGTAYVFKPASTTDHYDFYEKDLIVTASMPDASLLPSQQGLVGTFTPVTAPVGAYGYSAGNDGAHSYGQFVKVGGGVSLPSFRAYLWLEGSTPATLNAVFADEDGNVTSIETIEVSGDEPNTTIYSLDGRKLDHPEKGINIINGRKVLVR